MSRVFPSHSPRIPFKPSGCARRCCGRLVLTVSGNGFLKLPGRVPFGLVPGDILLLRKVSESFLRIETLRNFYVYPWHCSVRDDYLKRSFSSTLTDVSADAVVTIPWDLFPLPGGARVVLFAMDRITKQVLYLARVGAE